MTTQKVKNTAMAVITDVGDEKDIHPKKKEPVGHRLALAAEALAYGKKVEYSGPAFDKMTVDGNKAVLSFKHLGGGLEAKDGAADRLHHRRRGQGLPQRRGRDQGRYRRRLVQGRGEAGRGALRLGQLPGREPVEQGRPARLAVPHG